MKEYITKQLEEQIGKMEDDFVEEKYTQVGRRFGYVTKNILKDEKEFIDGIPINEKIREKKIEEVEESLAKDTETALEQETTHDKALGIIQAFNVVQAKEQMIMDEYFNDLVESVVSYKRKMENNGKATTKNPTDDMEKFLNKK